MEEERLLIYTTSPECEVSLYTKNDLTYVRFLNKKDFSYTSHMYHNREIAYNAYQEISRKIVFGEDISMPRL